jgi:hypothetical protein
MAAKLLQSLALARRTSDADDLAVRVRNGDLSDDLTMRPRYTSVDAQRSSIWRLPVLTKPTLPAAPLTTTVSPSLIFPTSVIP